MIDLIFLSQHFFPFFLINGIVMDLRYALSLLMDLDSCYRCTWGHGIDLDTGYSWYSVGTLESHTYNRAECYPYAGLKKYIFNRIDMADVVEVRKGFSTDTFNEVKT